MKRLVFVLALAGCGQKLPVQIGDHCGLNINCAEIPFGYCAYGRAGFCTRKCGPQAEVNSNPLGGVHDPSCPLGSDCVKEGPVYVCLPKCSGSGKICLGICEDGVCKAACDGVPCRACNRGGVPDGGDCSLGLYDRPI